MKKTLVIYLSSRYTRRKNLINFVNKYKTVPAGIKHTLLISFKNLSDKEIIIRKKICSTINCIIFIDPENKNDHEWGTIKRIAKNFINYNIFYMNDYSYPIKKNWLKIITKKFKNKTIIGCTGSYSSFANNSLIRKRNQNIFEYLFDILYFRLFVPSFPNPHLRANSFLIKSKDFLSFMKGRIVNNKKHSLLLESGYYSFTNFFKKKNYKLFVINSDEKLFSEKDWKLSTTFNFKKQEKLLISDKDTRFYQKLNKKNKIKRQLTIWGN